MGLEHAEAFGTNDAIEPVVDKGWHQGHVFEFSDGG